MNDTLPSVATANPSEQYYSNIRSDIMPMLSGLRGIITLDVGCGEGATSAFLKQQGISKESLGIEYSALPAAKTKDRIDDLKVGDVETMDLSDWHHKADLLLCLDVLEHLRDPWSALRKLAGCLKPNGLVVASIPNIQNFKVVVPLLRGEWQYQEYGLLDRTHLRFFTRKTAIELVESAGFAIEKEHGLMGRGGDFLNTATLGTLRGLFVYQYIFRARLFA